MTSSSSSAASPPPPRTLQALVSTLGAVLTAYAIAAPFVFSGTTVVWAQGVAAALGGGMVMGLVFSVRSLLQRFEERAVELNQQRALDQAATGQEVEKLRAALEQRETEWQQRESEWRQELDQGSEAIVKALQEALGVRLGAVWKGEAVPEAKVPAGLDPKASELLDKMVTETADAVGRQNARLESTQSALLALGRRVQAGAHRIQEQAVLMAQRNPANPDVLEVSNRVDHAAAVQARMAQSLAVLSGHWEGQQWPEPVPLDEVIRAAAGRITEYRRIELPGAQSVAVAARATEPLIHLLAELLANAAQSSPKTTKVLVSVRTVHQGTAVEIDDGGVGLDDHRLQQARDVASGKNPVGLDELGVIPQTGLAVVGEYVRRNGFRVDLQESVYGGLRAVVLVPASLVEITEPAVVAPAALTAEPQESRTAATPAPGTFPAETFPAETFSGETPSGLPRRRSRRGASALDAPDEAPAAGDDRGSGEDRTPGAPTFETRPTETPEEAGQWMDAFLRGGGDDHEDGAD